MELPAALPAATPRACAREAVALQGSKNYAPNESKGGLNSQAVGDLPGIEADHVPAVAKHLVVSVESENDTIFVDVDDDTPVVGWNYSSAGEDVSGEDDTVAGINGGSCLVGETCHAALIQGRRQRALLPMLLPVRLTDPDISRAVVGTGPPRSGCLVYGICPQRVAANV